MNAIERHTHETIAARILAEYNRPDTTERERAALRRSVRRDIPNSRKYSTAYHLALLLGIPTDNLGANLKRTAA